MANPPKQHMATRKARREPNLNLKREREIKGWSQADVAEKIGSQTNLVTRWETGYSFPRPYYRQKLCEIFGKNAYELGLLAEPMATNNHHPLHNSSALPDLYDPALPLSPSEIPDLIGRQTFIDQLVQALCSDKQNAFALIGLPGVGKTALAVALAHHPTVRQQFQDGILWIGLGQNPSMLESMHRLGTLLGVPLTEAEQLTSLDAWARRLYQQIGQRRMLLILDDAWELAEAMTFQLGGTHCVHLLTTRIPALAHAFAHEQVLQVPELNEDEGVVLLEHTLSQARQQIPAPQMRNLVRSVGGLPLALVLMGGYLFVQAQTGQPRRLQKALEQLQKNVKLRLHLNKPQAPGEHSSNLPIGTSLSLQMAIDISAHRLPKQAQIALQALSRLPSKPYSFSEEAALAACNMNIEVLDLLADSGLLGTHQPGRYHLHQTIRDYAHFLPTDPAVETRLVTFFVEFACMHNLEFALLDQDLHNIIAAFELARERQMFPSLLRGILAFIPFVRAMRLFAPANKLLSSAQQAALALDDQQSLCRVWLHQGEMAELSSNLSQAEHSYLTGLAIAQKNGYTQLTAHLLVLAGGVIVGQGDDARAEAYLQQGLAMVTTLGDQEQVSIALKNLGEIADNLGDPQKAQTLYQQSLTIARQQENWRITAALLQDLGSQAAHRGDYEQADTYFQEGLTYAQHLQDLQRQSAILMNQGLLACYRQEYTTALTLSLESLSLARKISHDMRISSVLQNLGIIEGFLGNEAQAEAYLQESLDLALAMGHRWLICETNGEWGTLYLRQQKLDAAWETFQKMLEEAINLRAQPLQAHALFGLARVEDHRKHYQKAFQYARQSHALFQTLQDRQANHIAQWLADRMLLHGNL